MSLSINVRLPKNKSQIIDISKATTVHGIKEEISKIIETDVNMFNLLFAGKVLNPEASIQDLNIGAGSVLHVFEKKGACELEIQPHRTGSPPKPVSQYFVFCKKCEGLFAAKLRVRCQECKQGAIILDQGPGSWNDVLTPEQILGYCNDCEKQQPAQFYFKCSSHDGDEEFSPLSYVKSNTREIECIICTEVMSPVLVYPCQDSHVVCVDCFRTYAQTNLDRRSFIADANLGYTLSCPADCENSLVKDVHHFQLLGKTQYERYKDFGAEECFIQSGGVFCPNQGCGEGMIIDDQATRVHCHACHYEFCRHCMQEVHRGECPPISVANLAAEALGIDSARAERSRWEAQSVYTIRQTTKPCPHCAVNTERNGGCMHMKCVRCRKEWCWLCEVPWNRGCQGDHWFG